jgi:hypothetical protein
MRPTNLLAAAAAVLTVAASASAIALAPASAARAAPPAGTLGTLGTLTMTPATGTDIEDPKVHTSAGCPEDSDAYNMYVFGPGAFASGFLITSTTDAGFSRTAGFDIFFSLTMRDVADELGTTIVAGDYPVVAQCVDSFFGDVKGTFTITMVFTDSTHYVTTDGTPTSTSSTSTTTTTTTTTTSTSTTTTTASSTTSSTTTTTNPNGPGADIGVVIPTVSTSPSSSGGSSTPSGGLAATGGPIEELLNLGFLLLAAGVTLLITAGRRREA